MPPGFDRFESFGHDELTAKHCYRRSGKFQCEKNFVKLKLQQN